MPVRTSRLVRAGALGVCSVLLIVFGAVIVLPGMIITAFNFQDDDVNTDWRIVGIVILGVGAVCLIIGIWLCCSVCSLCKNKDDTRRGTVISTVEGDRHVPNRKRRGKKKKTTTQSAASTQGPQVGYLPPNPGTRPTSAGYLPMSPQQGYQLGPSNASVTHASVPHYASVPTYPAVSNPGPTYPAVSNASPAYPPASIPGPLPAYPQQGYGLGPANAPLPPAVAPHHAHHPGPPGQTYPAVVHPPPMPRYPAPTSSNLPYNPDFMPPASLSQHTAYVHSASSASPSAPPQDDRTARPPTYDEAMSVSKI